MKIVFSDFDGTLTTNGMLGPNFFEIMNLIQSSNSELVIASGRSISWGHFLLTHFPLDAAIMEGGGVILLKDSSGRIVEDLLISEDDLYSLDEVTVKLINQFPDCPLSSDSLGRKTDRAIELRDLDDHSVLEDVKEFLKEEGMTFSCSDVHLNFWIGNQSKYKAIERFITKYKNNIGLDDVIYYGDSLNDESAFEGLPHSVGVSNIEKVLGKLSSKPATILEGEENRGSLGVLSHLKSSIFNS